MIHALSKDELVNLCRGQGKGKISIMTLEKWCYLSCSEGRQEDNVGA